MIRREKLTAYALVLVLFATGWASALETDQYWAWGQPLADSTAAVNAKLNLELERTLAGLKEPAARSCLEVARIYRNRMRYVLMHDIQLWAWNSQYVARIPDNGNEHAEYRRNNLYSQHPLIDVGTWMPITPTIAVAGVRFGTDKLSHFVSSGWSYFVEYRQALERGQSDEEARIEAVKRGLFEEGLILGKMASGIFSLADLEAGYAGLLFYEDLCRGEAPMLVLDDGGWVVREPVDLRRYVTPRWDESFQTPVFGPKRWRWIQPVLETYCDRLDDPMVVEQRRRYRERDSLSPVGDLVAARVAAGELDDPAQFALETVCSVRDRPVDPEPQSDAAPAMPDPETVDLAPMLIAEESDRRRMNLVLLGAHVSYPAVVSASIGMMRTSRPAGSDCQSLCDFRGPLVELEPGLGSWKLSLGWARVNGRLSRRGPVLAAGYFGAAYKVTLLRTWNDAGWLPKNRTYAGFELAVPVAQANVGLGLLARVDGGEGRRWTITASAGWGF